MRVCTRSGAFTQADVWKGGGVLLRIILRNVFQAKVFSRLSLSLSQPFLKVEVKSQPDKC